MQTKILTTMALFGGLMISANAALITTELITNGDLEADGHAGTGANNLVTAITGWGGVTKISTTGDGNTIPEAPNTVFRMQTTVSMYQDGIDPGDWDSGTTFTVSLNACEVYWQAGTTSPSNLLWISFRPDGGGSELEAKSIDLDNTHGGSGVTYATWQANQTHILEFTGQELIDGGATAGDDLRLNIYSRQINWVDNISVLAAVPEPSSALMLLGSLGLLFMRNRRTR